MKRLSFTLLMLLVSCGKSPTQNLSLDQVAPYLKRFDEAAEASGGTLVIPAEKSFVQFGVIPASSPDPNASCDGSGITPTLTVNNLYWVTADNERKELLIFRSLGSCLLNRTYDSSVDGIMNPRPSAYFLESYLSKPGFYQTLLFKGL